MVLAASPSDSRVHSVAGDDDPIECETRFGAVPCNEPIKCECVDAARSG